MKNLVNSVWQDLRAKRLWPVAALLLVALVAIPVFFIKPAKSPAPSSPQAAAGGQKVRALTPLTDAAASGQGSNLDVFDATDPFLPPKAVIAAAKSGGTTAGATISRSAGASTQSSSSGSGSSSSSSSSSSPSQGGSGGSGGGTGGSTGGGNTGTGGGGGKTTVKYAYVVDVTFTRNGRTTHVSGLERLEMLPNEASPLLIFLGADSGGDDAVFLVDSDLRASGEGHCSPSDDECGVLSISPGSVEEFTDGKGNSYKLRIDEIRKVRVSAASAKSSRRAKRARASSAGPQRSFSPPALVDLVTVASPADRASSSDKDRR